MQSISIIAKFILAYLISFYTLSTPKNNGGNINFNNFAGKKVLIVNTAINSPDTMQYRRLEQLHLLYKDSLVVIALPTNDFNNTPMSDSSIKVFLNTKYNIHYRLGAKVSVKGANISPVYEWLTNQIKNGQMNGSIQGDFYKYLIDKNGNIVGVFDTKEDPMGANIRNAVEAVY
jgi:glutathione peroxidase